MPSVTQPRILITGASGGFGQAVIPLLLENGADPAALILLTRNPSRLAQHAACGIDVRQGSFDDPLERLAATFAGADVVLMISTSRAGARIPQHHNAINAAVQAGARQIVYTSFVGADLDDATALVVREHCATERMLRDSGISWTALRDSMYSEVLAEVAAPLALRQRMLMSNAANGRLAFVSRDDCASAAAAVLSNPSAHLNKVYNITGPELLSWADAAELMGRISGLDIGYRELSDEEQLAVFDHMGIPREPGDEFEKDGVQGYHWNSSDMVTFSRAVRQGEMEVISDDVQQLTGSTPKTLHDVLKSRMVLESVTR